MQSTSRSISLWLLRILATLWLLQLLAQVWLAAAFVSGDTDLFGMHSLNGSMMNTAPFFMIVAGAFHVSLGRGRWWALVVPIVLLLLCETQAVLGYTRVVGAHILGGTLLLTIATLWCIGLWRHRHRPRPRRRDRRAVPIGPAGQSVDPLETREGARA